MSHKVVTKEQLTAALELVVSQGLNSAEAAVKLGVSKPALMRWLKKTPQYLQHRERQKAKENEDREKVLVMGRTGYTASIIAKELGLPLMTTRTWLSKAGIDVTKKGSDDLTCPACDGIMKKQELFFWMCDRCGSEWWPKEAPDNPDDWTRPWRIRYGDGGKEMLGIATRLRSEGYSSQEICDKLNDQGIKTNRGKEWTKNNLNQQFERRGIVIQGGDRTRIEDIVKVMAEKGYYSKDIAMRLNSEGLMNSQGKKWTKSGICIICKKIGVKLIGKQGIHLKSDCNVHPWVADETARLEKNRAWRRSHDVPSL